EVVVVTKRGVLVPGLPVARGLDAGAQGAVLQHRQVETRSIPGDQVGGELVDTVIEALDQLGLRRARIPEAPPTQAVAAAQHTGDGDDPVLLEAEELPAGHIPAQGEHGFGDLLVAESFEAVQAAAELDVGDRFDVEDENVHVVRAATISAFMSATAFA